MKSKFILTLCLCISSFSTIIFAQCWKAVDGGSFHTIGIKEDGTLWVWGQHGLGSTNVYNIPYQLGTATNWKSVGAGGASGSRSFAIKEDGTLWVYRNNILSQVGTDNDWQTVNADDTHILAIKQNGSLWAWGWNLAGELGDGTTISRTAPTQIGTDKNWKIVSAGCGHSLAIKNDSTLWAWGGNAFGQVGDGTTTNKYVPVRIGTAKNWATLSAGCQNSFAIKQDGTIWAWGYNNGQLGNGTWAGRIAPTLMSTLSNWKEVYSNGEFTLVLKKDGTLWGCGVNSYGQLGPTIGGGAQSAYIQIGTATDWQSARAGLFHSVALKQDGTLWTWGANASGQLGNGTVSNNNSTPTSTGICVPTPSVTICNQVWMQKNLDVTTYRNGDPIPQVTNPSQWANLTTGAWCYNNNDPAMGAIYGKLYNWYAVNDPRGLAPVGWHIPTDAECITLTFCLGGHGLAGGAMKETGTTHWLSSNGGATNTSGFTGLPGGCRIMNSGAFSGIGATAFFWCSTNAGSINSYYFNLQDQVPILYRLTQNKTCGFSVRCIKD